MNQTANALATTEPKTFKDLVALPAYKEQLSAALPKHITADRMVRIVLTAMNRQPLLMKCTKESVWLAVLDCSQLGLEPDALGRAYLVPYGDQCKLILGYRGLCDLAYRSGEVETIQAQVVYERDTWELEFGTNEKLVHKPADGDRGKPLRVYAYCRMKGGAFKADVMSVDDVDQIRKRSKSGNNGPWVTDWAEMAKKTVLRRMLKTVPMSSEKLSDALIHDNEDTDLKIDAPSRFQEDTVTTHDAIPDNAPAAKPNA